jgi:cation transport protein ChaC
MGFSDIRRGGGKERADGEDLWVFAYGSLMWRPGFAFEAVQPALLRGYRRAFCIYSHHYRGTPDHPGLVLGLDRGGSCRGLAFRVAAGRAREVIDYLNERELLSYAYVPRRLSVRLADRSVRAYTFVADRSHSQYAAGLDPERAADIIMNARGVAGLNRDYLINTVRQLQAEGFTDPHLHALLTRIEVLTGVIDAGAGI